MISYSPVLIVEAEYYDEINSELTAGAKEVLKEKGIKYKGITVPGVFEIPAAVKMGYETGNFMGFVAIGCVIRGETSHYDYVCSESAHGLNYLAFNYGLAIGYGILTVENMDQAWARASREKGNKGAMAAATCIHMMSLREDPAFKV